MDTDEAGEVSLEPEGTAVGTQKSEYLKNAIRYSYARAIRWSVTGPLTSISTLIYQKRPTFQDFKTRLIHNQF